MNRTTQWLVTHHPSGYGQGPGASIPTLGAPASASDMFRVVGYTKSGHEGWNSCYTDAYTCQSLSKLVEGEILEWAQIEAAETALQILMWHDRVDIMVPAFKAKQSNFSHYFRCEESRSNLSYELFRPCSPYDVFYAIEEVDVENGEIKKSNYKHSSIIGRELGAVKNSYLKTTPLQSEIFSTLPMDMGVPAYFSDPHIQKFFDKRGHFGQFYGAINKNWQGSSSIIPDIDSNFLLPPLTSIVLTRAKSRDEIPQAIFSLRDELLAVRQEMLGFSESIKSEKSQAEIEERCKKIKESFEATFPASRHKESKVILPLLQLYKAFKSPVDTLLELLNPNFVPNNPKIIANRTVTGKMFSNLLVTEAMYSLLNRFFTQAEIRNLERSYKAQN